MNVSLEGIVGKNAMDDLDSEGSTTTKSVSPVQPSDGQQGSTDESSGSTPFQECDCNVRQSRRVDALAKRDKEEKGKASKKTKASQAEPKKLGETSVEILLPPTSRGASPDEDDDDDDDDNDDQGATCALIPELKNIDDQQLSFGDFAQDLGRCTPKCCSLLGSETTCVEAVVEVEDDDELEEMLDEAAEDDGEGDDDNLRHRPSVCSTCGGEPHDHQDCSL